MANAFSTDAIASGKSYSSFMPFSPPVLVAGVVQHELISLAAQTRILRIVEETGSASLGEIVEGLGEHPNPAGAVLVLVDLGILAIGYRDVIDDHSVLRRAAACPASDTGAAEQASWQAAPATNEVALPPGIESMSVSPFAPALAVAAGDARRGLGKIEALNRPGIYALVGERQIYVGASSSVGTRVASGQQPIGDIQSIIVITDANNALTEEDARAAERMFFTRIQATRAFAVMNDLPMGAGVDAQRYSEIDSFLGQICLALRHNGVLFTEGTARNALAGPRNEAGRVAALRPFDDVPSGERLEMCFDDGLFAQVARQHDTRWVLLQGSDIRMDTATSANSSVRFLRSAWAHGGLLELSADGRSFVTTRDLVFRSGSGVAQFCVGSKGRTRDSWTPVDPDGGFDPDTPALIAA